MSNNWVLTLLFTLSSWLFRRARSPAWTQNWLKINNKKSVRTIWKLRSCPPSLTSRRTGTLLTLGKKTNPLSWWPLRHRRCPHLLPLWASHQQSRWGSAPKHCIYLLWYNHRLDCHWSPNLALWTLSCWYWFWWIIIKFCCTFFVAGQEKYNLRQFDILENILTFPLQDPFSPSKQEMFSPPPLERFEPPQPAQPALPATNGDNLGLAPTRNGLQNGFNEFVSSKVIMSVVWWGGLYLCLGYSGGPGSFIQFASAKTI